MDGPDLLALWEAAGAARPHERATLLAGGSPEQPLGARDAALLRRRAALFGDAVEVAARCEACGEALELPVSARALAEGCAGGPPRPTAADVADALPLPRGEARRLLAGRAAGVAPETLSPAEVDAIERELEASGAPGDLRLGFACPACGAAGEAGFDPGAELWRELDRAADDLLADVAALARAYGWTQAEALGLSPVRRARYLALAR